VRFLFVLAAALALFVAPAAAHEIGMVSVEVTFAADGTYRIVIPIDPITVSQRLAVAAGRELTEQEPTEEQARQDIETMQAEVLERIRVVFDGQRVLPTLVYRPREPLPTGPIADLELSGAIPAGAKAFQFLYKLTYARYVLKVQAIQGQEPTLAYLEGAQLSDAFPVMVPLPPTKLEIVRTYLWLGFTHILPKGLDHILFVLGLFLLAAHWRPLLWQVTAFTAAHTLTLGLATYGVVSLPAEIVEPLIALSIVYVAVENVARRELSRWRLAVVFAFGLLHGLGFAGVLHELGLPASQVFTALLSFNVGVELGQLTVIALAFVAVASWARDEPWYHRRVVIPGSLLIAAVGLYWTVERLWGALAG
jgi:hydrogenase/urease accessory protein HupE